MGSGPDTDAYLVYGFNLGGGGGAEGFLVGEADSNGQISLPWFRSDHDDDLDFTDQAMSLLDQAGLAAQGIAVGLRIVTYQSRPFPMFFLAASVFRAPRGHLVPISLEVLAARATDETHALLDKGLEVLGLTPLQEQPSWNLMSYWDLDG